MCLCVCDPYRNQHFCSSNSTHQLLVTFLMYSHTQTQTRSFPPARLRKVHNLVSLHQTPECQRLSAIPSFLILCTHLISLQLQPECLISSAIPLCIACVHTKTRTNTCTTRTRCKQFHPPVRLRKLPDQSLMQQQQQ